MMLDWQWSSFSELSPVELYQILAARQAVFCVEQNCVYQDVDGLDQQAWHLLGWSSDGSEPVLQAYLRVVVPGLKYEEPSIGRVLTMPAVRGTGLGREILAEGVRRVEAQCPGCAIRISAQQHLVGFYSEFGFNQVSPPYDEDGIPHVEMLRSNGAQER